MQLQTTSPESKFPNEYIGVIFIQIDQHLKKLLKKYKGVPILWNTVYINSQQTTWLLHTLFGSQSFGVFDSNFTVNCVAFGSEHRKLVGNRDVPLHRVAERPFRMC